MREGEEREVAAVDAQRSVSARPAIHGLPQVARNGDLHHLLESPRKRVPSMGRGDRSSGAEEREQRSPDVVGSVLSLRASEPEQVMAGSWRREFEVKVSGRVRGGWAVGGGQGALRIRRVIDQQAHGR